MEWSQEPVRQGVVPVKPGCVFKKLCLINICVAKNKIKRFSKFIISDIFTLKKGIAKMEAP